MGGSRPVRGAPGGGVLACPSWLTSLLRRGVGGLFSRSCNKVVSLTMEPLLVIAPSRGQEPLAFPPIDSARQIACHGASDNAAPRDRGVRLGLPTEEVSRPAATLKILVTGEERAGRIHMAELIGALSECRAAAAPPARVCERLAEEGFDLLVVDLPAGFIAGGQLVASLRPRSGAGAQIPMLVLTGEPDPRVTRDLIEAGANLVMPKPPHREKLSSLLSLLTPSTDGPPLAN